MQWNEYESSRNGCERKYGGEQIKGIVRTGKINREFELERRLELEFDRQMTRLAIVYNPETSIDRKSRFPVIFIQMADSSDWPKRFMHTHIHVWPLFFVCWARSLKHPSLTIMSDRERHLTSVQKWLQDGEQLDVESDEECDIFGSSCLNDDELLASLYVVLENVSFHELVIQFAKLPLSASH